jgi:hypothetical protein
MARGFNAVGDLIRTTEDGVGLDVIWAEFQATLDMQNASRDALVALLSQTITRPALHVAAIGDLTDEMELASQYGEPQGHRRTSPVIDMGATFAWYDKAARYTAMYLYQATADEIRAVHDECLELDNRLVAKGILGAVFNGTARTNEQGTPVFPLLNGDGTIPPPYLGRVFSGSHNHLITSGSASLDPGDVDTLLKHVTEHGHADRAGSQLLLLVNETEGAIIRTFRAGQGVPPATYDFVPSAGSPPRISAEQVIGQTPPAKFQSLDVIGSYGKALVVESPHVPAGYLLTFVTGGSGSQSNVVLMREHPKSELRGLKLINPMGQRPDYPLIDSYYLRLFGTGIRHRSSAAVLQVTAAGAYTAPPQFAAP